jgi:hypothetical protein
MAGLSFFAVSIYPKRSSQLTTCPTWEDLFEFALAHVDVLLKPFHAIGTWFNRHLNVHVLDIVVLVADRAEAMELGLRFQQWSIFDLSKCSEIPIAQPSPVLNRINAEVRP